MKLVNSIALTSILFGSALSFTPTSNIYNGNHNHQIVTRTSTTTQLNAQNNCARRGAITTLVASGLASLFPGVVIEPANALVEGNPVPSKSPKKSLPEEYRQGTLTLSDTDSKAAVPDSAYKKLPSGVIYADLRQGGDGNEIGTGSRVNLQWVLRKSNGYFVDSSEVQDGVPFIFTVGDKKAIAGLDEGVQGMKQGGTRRLLIPPSLAYSQGLDDGCPGPLPAGFGPRQQMRRVQNVRKDVPGEYVFLEIQITRVR